MSKAKAKAKQTQPYRIYAQYVLIGAALGLYYGLFYKDTPREPDYAMAVLLSILAAVVTVIIRSWKKGRSFKEILVDFLKISLAFMVFMVGIEMRKLVFGLGGKAAVSIFTTILGTVLGFFMALKKKPTS